MAGLETNLFAIGRARKDENQLTALLGALFHHEPDALGRVLDGLDLGIDADAAWEIETEHVHSQGRFDLVLDLPGVARYLVESKINAPLAPDQVARYLAALRHEPGERALIVLTRDPVALSIDDAQYAKQHRIALLQCRWAEIADWVCPASGEGGSLATDFKELLMSEGLATGPALGDEAWNTLSAMPGVLRQLQTLVEVAALKIAGPADAGEGEVDRAARLQEGRRVSADIRRGDHLVRIALAASDGGKLAAGPPILAVAVTYATTPKEERRAWAEARAPKIDGAGYEGRWVRRTIPVSELAGAGDLSAQAELVAEKALDLLAAVRGVDVPGAGPG